MPGMHSRRPVRLVVTQSERRSDLLHNISRKSAPDLRPIGSFATWQAERVIGDHDRNMLRLRLDPRRRARQALSQI